MVKWINFDSKALAGFKIQDACDRKFPIILPPNYSDKRDLPYPVIFVLCGFGSRPGKYIDNYSAFGESLSTKLLTAMEDKKLPEAIIVFPDCSNKFGCSQYINSPVFGNYFDYLNIELIDFIDQNYHTYKSADFRGICGHSSGGFGALMAAMRGQSFKYICSSAADSFYPGLFIPAIKDVIISIEKHGSITKFLEWFYNLPDPGLAGGQAFNAMLLLAMAPCFAPNLDNPPLYGDLFFDLKTGEIIEDIWQKYLAWDPVVMLDKYIDKYIDNLKNLSWMHLDAGVNDEYSLQLGQRQIAAKLKQNNINHIITEYKGGHSGHSYRFVERIGLMLDRMFSNRKAD